MLILVGLLALTACGGDSKEESEDKASEPVASVSIQMAWTHEYSVAGLYAAAENGHYADRNLEVTLVEGGFGENGYIEPIEVVVNGTYDFGMSGAEALIRARAEGKPVVAIATIMQRSPNAIISLVDANILRPQDLSDHTVLVADGGALGLYNALLSSQNVPADSVNTQPRTEFGVSPLLDGDADALMGWVINEGVQIQEAGQTPNYILLSDYGIDTYNLVLFTTETTIQERPQIVEALLSATLEGYQDAIANPSQAAEYVVKNNSSLD
jgi:NitT/TauT family transport system substrate-binding protein